MPSVTMNLLTGSQMSSVQGFPSVQYRSSGVLAQPVTGSQESTVQPRLSSQLMVVPTQVPWVQVSASVHRSLSSQGWAL